MNRFLSVLTFAFAFLVGAADAQDITPRAVSVATADVDLSTTRGAAIVLRRIERAADRVCGASIARSYPSQRPIYRACREATIESALTEIDAPLLHERYAERRHQRAMIEAARG